MSACASSSAGKQAVVSTNDIGRPMSEMHRRARGGHGAESRPTIFVAGLAEPSSARDAVSRSRPARSGNSRASPNSKRARLQRKSAGARGQGRLEIRRRLGLRRHRRHGARHKRLASAAPISRSRHGLSVTAIAGEGTGMERDYDYARRSTTRPRSARKIGRSAGERAISASIRAR